LKDVGNSASLGERQVISDHGSVTLRVTPARALADLNVACDVVEERIAAINVQSIRVEDARTLAHYYLALNRYSEAEEVLQPIVDRNAAAALDLARLLRQRGRPIESRELALIALRQACSAAQRSTADAAGWDKVALGAYELLAMLAGDSSDFATAEKHLLDALRRLPMHRAIIHGRLAKHYEFVGELSRAQAHEAQAALADPQAFPPPEGLVTKILSTSAPIGLARPRSSQYK
jgi:tetratricopeptide (TPR) repeat protein